MSSQHADVLIIGAGAAGGVAARRLTEAGLSVVALEQGYWHERENYRGSEWDWELTSAKQWSCDPAVRGRKADAPIDASDSDVAIMNFNGVGGGTIIYNGVWLRLLESNFRTRTLHGVGDDWPISYQDLQPFYERTDQEIGVSGLGGNPAYPAGKDPPLPPLPLWPGALEIARAMHRREWHWWPETNAILSGAYDGRHPCIQRGTCRTGCNEGAKSSIDATHWRRAAALGARVVTGARVRRILLDAQGLASGAEWVDENGVEHFQSANVVLCSANAVGTARLLLNSACEAFPQGLANRSGLVGKRLMVHPLGIVSGLFPDRLESWQGHDGSALQSLQFGEMDSANGLAGAKWSLHPTGGPTTEAFNIFAEHGTGGDFNLHFKKQFGRRLIWTVMCEDLPEVSNRVELSPSLVDDAGMPIAKVVYRHSEQSVRTLETNIARAREVFAEAGAWKVGQMSPLPAAFHLMGTARMGDDPANSVVDRWGLSHDIPNLGVIDGSVFVTSGPVNPTSTICALALRAADHLVEVHAQLPKPGAPIAAAAIARRIAPARVEPPSPAALGEAARQQLQALAAAIIPGSNEMPSAAEIGLECGLVDRVLNVRDDLRAPLDRALTASAAPPQVRLQEIADADPEAHQALLAVVVGAYCLDDDVRTAIGYPGQIPRPQKPDNYPAYVAEGLLDHMLDPI